MTFGEFLIISFEIESLPSAFSSFNIFKTLSNSFFVNDLLLSSLSGLVLDDKFSSSKFVSPFPPFSVWSPLKCSYHFSPCIFGVDVDVTVSFAYFHFFQNVLGSFSDFPTSIVFCQNIYFLDEHLFLYSFNFSWNFYVILRHSTSNHCFDTLTFYQFFWIFFTFSFLPPWDTNFVSLHPYFRLSQHQFFAISHLYHLVLFIPFISGYLIPFVVISGTSWRNTTFTTFWMVW